MGLKIYWTDFAKNELKRIFDYHQKEASVTVAKKIVKGVAEETKRLCSHPKIGQTEEALIERSQQFRYIVHSNYKIIYWINDAKNQIEIADVFDTRQNPIKIHRI